MAEESSSPAATIRNPSPTTPITPTTMKDAKALVSFYSNYLWNRILSFLPNPNSNFLTKISNVFRTTTRATKRRRRRTCLPLPLPPASTSPGSSLAITSEASKIFEVLEDVMECIFLNLHYIQKNLQFWQSRAEGSNAQKAYFMVCERGPNAFVNGIIQLIRDSLAESSGIQSLYCSASSYMSERIIVLTNLRYFLSAFLAQVYVEIDKVGEDLVKEPDKSVPSLLVAINDLFLNLESSIGHFHAMRQGDSSVDGSYSFPLVFEKLPEVNQEGSQWTECETRDAINLIYQNLQKLNSYLFTLVAKHRRPRKMTLYWMRYTCGVAGVSLCSIWLLRHSRLMGSSDIDNWIREAKESILGFWNDHVEQPLLSIRDELFETFRKRQKGVMEREEVQLTADSLHRMLLAFSEQTKGQKLPQNASDQEMLEIVMARYEKELMHPIQNLVGGELVRALLIQIQKLKLDIETAMLELDQILRANEINFAILAALPAFALSLILLMLVRAWFKQDTRAEGRGRVARIQRRLLIVEIERGIMQIQMCRDQGLETDAECMFGLVLYGLDRLYCAVERHAKATGEWLCLRQDMHDLAKPGLQTAHKLIIVSRMERIWKEAAQRGDIQALYSLFRQNPNLLEDIDKISLIDTPLHIAVSAGHTFFCLEIMTLKPSFGKKLNPDGLSPLLLALQNGHISTASWLVLHNPELIRVQGRDRFTPLHYLADVGDNIDLLKTFVSSCPKSIEDWSVEGETAVHIALKRGHVRTLKVLLNFLEQTKSEHILDWLDCRGYAVLHVAAAANNYEVVSLLVKKVNINLKTWGGEKATDLATDERVLGLLRAEELARTLKPKISFKTRLNRLLLSAHEEISSVEQVNALLVAAALIVTATFQAVLSPPGGDSSGNDSPTPVGGNSSGYKKIPYPFFFQIFLFINSVTFVSSLVMIELLLQKLHKSRLLRVSIFFLSACYAVLMGIVSPPLFFLLSAIGACLFLIWVF